MEQIDVIVDIEVNKFVDSIKRELKRDINNFLADKKTTKIEDVVKEIQYQMSEEYHSIISWINTCKDGKFTAEQLITEGRLQTLKFINDILVENLEGYESVIPIENGTTEEV